jgi:hypothetical protein
VYEPDAVGTSQHTSPDAQPAEGVPNVMAPHEKAPPPSPPLVLLPPLVAPPEPAPLLDPLPVAEHPP